MSKVGDIIAGNSAVIHSNGPGHLWRQRHACPLCMSDETPAKEPPPPAVTEQIADIVEAVYAVADALGIRSTVNEAVEWLTANPGGTEAEFVNYLDLRAATAAIDLSNAENREIDFQPGTPGPITKLFSHGEMTDGD